MGAAIALFGYRRYVRAGQVYENLAARLRRGPAGRLSPGVPGFYAITHFVERVGEKLPPDPKNASRYRLELIAAGYRAPNAVAIYFGLKIALVALFTRWPWGFRRKPGWVCGAGLPMWPWRRWAASGCRTSFWRAA